MIHLFTVSYKTGNPARQSELAECLRRNLANPHFGQLHVWHESGPTPEAAKKLTLRAEKRPPTFDDLFAWASTACAPDDVAVVANSDVWFDKTARHFAGIKPGQFYALLRHEADGKLFSTKTGRLRDDAQDAWVFRPPLPPLGLKFGLGKPRNDNALAHRLLRAGYDLRNPAKTIRIHHLHASGERPLGGKKHRVPPPWAYIEPTEIHQRGKIRTTNDLDHLRWNLRRIGRKIAGAK